MLTFQDFEKEPNRADFVYKAIQDHKAGDDYKTAILADKYDRQQNETINTYVQTIFTLSGSPVEDFTASNNKIASNFFHRLNTQRCTYSLGNGIRFTQRKETVRDDDGMETTVDLTKEALGLRFDTDMRDLAYNGLIHGVCFGFWNVDRLYVFPITEFVPFYDEDDGTLRAGIRFWQLSNDKPLIAVLYEEDGYTKYRTLDDDVKKFTEIEPKKAYKTIVQKSEADGEQIVGYDNYSSLPIVPFWGSRLKQSTLIGMRSAIDSFDLIRSGFANDLTDCSQIYWIVENCGGMSDAELAKFRDRLKINHIAVADRDNSDIKPYTQEIPYQARKEYLDHIKAGIYEDFGALDVHTVEAGATNDHIDAAYQPMDEEADDFEFQIIEFIQQILLLNGIEDTPEFKRNRISNQKEQVEMVMMETDYLDDETVLTKLPNISVDEIQNILIKKDEESQSRFDEAAEIDERATELAFLGGNEEEVEE